MDGLDRKVEAVYAPGAPFQGAAQLQVQGRSFSRRARILLVAVTAAVTLGLHVFKHRLYAPDYPEILVHPAPVTLVEKLTKEFDWESVSRPSLLRTAPRPSPSTLISSSSPPRSSTGLPATTASNARGSSSLSTTSLPTKAGRRLRSRCA